jgi:hypothetical protein
MFFGLITRNLDFFAQPVHLLLNVNMSVIGFRAKRPAPVASQAAEILL